jgi:TRAP-type C4-dicarboxylate transport system permease small subunit
VFAVPPVANALTPKGKMIVKSFKAAVLKADFSLFAVSGIALVCMMAVTLVDVTMRSLGRPIVGSVELISFLGAIAIGFALPYTTWTKGHILVDFAQEKLSPKGKRRLLTVTRSAGIILFLLVGYNFILYGLDLMKSNQTSGAFKLPLYPIAFGLAVSSFLQVATLVCDLWNVVYGEKHE